jgi:uncharacterized repeat protein (TIGR03803 family)
MTKPSAWKTACAVFVLCAVTASPAQVFTTLADFNSVNGADPRGISLVQGPDGNLYGTTPFGGDYRYCNIFGCGTMFKMTPSGKLTTLYEFCTQDNCSDGQYPGGLVQTNRGIYGTTGGGGGGNCGNGCGTIFRITPQGKLTTLYRFCSQAGCPDGTASSPLVLAADEAFYGTTVYGGDTTCNPPYGCGTVFRITPSGSLTTLHIFEGTDGDEPNGLIQATDRNLYGTTIFGGSSSGTNCNGGCGTVFKVTPRGTLTSLHSFDYTDGARPYAGLIQASDGSFYGTTSSGGAIPNCPIDGCGTIFKMTPQGSLTTLISFDAGNGGSPGAALFQATDGNLYGTTQLGGDLGCDGPVGCGILFQITPGGVLTTLHNFVGYPTEGQYPLQQIAQSTSGNLYGTTFEGGTSSNYGTVFSLGMGLGPFVAFVRGYGRVAQTGGILGQGFTGTTSVSLNGTPASFTVVSDTFIQAIVPPGATTGYVTVTTPSGRLTSNVPFHVIP